MDILEVCNVATIKKVELSAKLVEGFKIEATAGNHTVIVDQPTGAGGTDAGPTPVDYLFVSLAGCVITVAQVIARQKKIQLRDIKVEIEGELDLDRFHGRSFENRAGFSSITVKVDLDADMTPEEKKAFIEEVDNRCPISDNIMNETPVTFEAV